MHPKLQMSAFLKKNKKTQISEDKKTFHFSLNLQLLEPSNLVSQLVNYSDHFELFERVFYNYQNLLF